jgi:hypothetical protein
VLRCCLAGGINAGCLLPALLPGNRKDHHLCVNQGTREG